MQKRPKVAIATSNRQIAPIDFTEIHSDLGKTNSKKNVHGAWIGFLFLAPIFYFLGWTLGGIEAGCGVVLLTAVWPLSTALSFKANSELFRYYTWIYRTTTAVRGYVEVVNISSDSGVEYKATVKIGEDIYDCDVIARDRSKNLDGFKQEMLIRFDPVSGAPLCAEDERDTAEQLRIWLEPTLF